MLLESVQELDMSLWKDFWKAVVVNVDGDSLKTLQLWFWIWADNLELDDLCGIGDNHVDVNSCGAIVLEFWWLFWLCRSFAL